MAQRRRARHGSNDDVGGADSLSDGRSNAGVKEASRYPGSPLLASQALRDSDRIVLVEQQITEAQALERALHGRRGASVVCGDGYAALKTYLPPRENRGLVLIDPPYESEQGIRTGRRPHSSSGLDAGPTASTRCGTR